MAELNDREKEVLLFLFPKASKKWYLSLLKDRYEFAVLTCNLLKESPNCEDISIKEILLEIQALEDSKRKCIKQNGNQKEFLLTILSKQIPVGCLETNKDLANVLHDFIRDQKGKGLLNSARMATLQKIVNMPEKGTILSLIQKPKKEVAFAVINKNYEIRRVLTDALWGENVDKTQIDFIYEVNQLILHHSTKGSEPDLTISLIESGSLSLEQATNLQYALETEDVGHQKKGYYKFRMHKLRDSLLTTANSIAKVLDNREISISKDKRIELQEDYDDTIILFNKIVYYLAKSKR